MKIAVTGALGQLGGELCRQIGPQAIPLDIDNLDLTDAAAVNRMLLEQKPGLIINCAAYTQVDKAEQQPDLARAVNAGAVENLVNVCRELDCPLVQVSTDYVFAGNTVDKETGAVSQQAVAHAQPTSAHTRPFREDDTPMPLGMYAKTKFEGERAAAKWEKHIIVRTCGLYARPSDPKANNFVKTMIRLGGSRPELRVVADQHCTPTYVPQLARALMFLGGVNTGRNAPWGVYHVTNTGETVWCDFAKEIFRLSGIDVKVTAITTAEYNAPAARPAYSVLDTTKYHRLGGPAMTDWKAALVEYFDEWKAITK